METGWLEDFLTLGRQLNFSRAAEERNITQSAMSRRIRGLEEWLGVPVVSRDTHRLTLTAAGQAFQDHAADLLRNLRLARAAARAASEQHANSLNIASTHLLSTRFFPRWLSEIEAHVPIGQVQLRADHMMGCERLMETGTAHFLLCHRHPDVPDGLDAAAFRAISLADDRLVPVSAPVPGAGDRPLHRLDATENCPLLAFDEMSGMGRILRAVHDVPPGSPGFTSHLASILHIMALDGRGVAFLPLSLVEPDLQAGRLVRAGHAGWEIGMTICLVRPRARLKPSAETLWTHLSRRAPPAPTRPSGSRVMLETH